MCSQARSLRASLQRRQSGQRMMPQLRRSRIGQRMGTLSGQGRIRARTDLWMAEQYLETTINSIPGLIWYKDKEGIHRKVNNSFCHAAGKTKQQVEGRDHYYIWDVDPNDPENAGNDCEESDRKVMESRRTCISEETVMTGDGMRLMTTYKSPLYDIDGSVIGTAGVGIDVTQERTYEKEIITKNRALEALFTSIDCGVLCHSLDGKRILSVNRAALEILGYESEEEMLETGFDMVADSVLDEDKERMRACIQSLKHVGDSTSVEYRVCHSDGELVYVLGNIKLQSQNGELFYQRFLVDCTEQKLQEKRNERHQAELVQALSIDYNVVCFFNLDTENGMLLRIDDNISPALEAVFEGSLTFSGCLERYIEEFVCEEDQDTVRREASRAHLLDMLAAKGMHYINYRMSGDAEAEFYQMKIVRSGTWDESHGIVLGLRSVDEETRSEMEQKQRLEEALQEANRASSAKSVFLSNMSHDIRTPMNAIVGFTTLALSRMDHPEQVREYLRKIMVSGNHLLGLINDVLDMSRIESGRMQLEEAPCSLADILHGLNNIVMADIRAKHLRLHVNTVDIVNEEVWCDKLRLNQALLNLISNSIKYTKDGGDIYICVTQKPGAAEGFAKYEFCVRDNGIGMSSDFVAHIFEPFEREKNTTTSGIQGTGLGMAITKNLVDMMKGTIEVRSEENAGTEVTLEFTFRLNEKAPKLQPLPELAGCRALVVDGDPESCTSISKLLGSFGMQAECACTGCRAISLVRDALRDQDGYRVILLDWRLTDRDMIEVIRTFKKEAGEDASLIVMTEYNWSEIEEQVKEAGAAALCAKPLFPSRLAVCLRSVLMNSGENEEREDGGRRRFSGGRLLLAEDNELNQELAQELLEDYGFEVEIAGNGQIAVDMVKRSRPGYYRLVLMDVQMPVMNGYEATRAIRALPDQQLASIPIFAVTANAFREDQMEALESGMNGHIMKPIDVDQLMETLDRVLG